MIEKLPEIQIHSCAKINEKLNEVIDWVNDVSALRVTDKQVTANLPNIDAGELAFLSKENSDLKDEVENLIKIIDDINVSLWDIWNNTKDLETARKIARDAMKKYGEL